MSIRSRSVGNGQKLETTQIPFDRWINEQIIAYLYGEILLSNLKGTNDWYAQYMLYNTLENTRLRWWRIDQWLLRVSWREVVAAKEFLCDDETVCIVTVVVVTWTCAGGEISQYYIPVHWQVHLKTNGIRISPGA